MKRIAILIALVLCAGSVSAQIVNVEPVRIINRVDAQTGAYERSTVELAVPSQAQLGSSSFLITFDSVEAPLVSGNSVAITGHMTNTSIGDVEIKFFRRHVHLPATWTASICFGDNCYAPRTDSFPSTASGYILPQGGSGEFRLSMYCPANCQTSDSIVDYVKFVAVGGKEGDTMGITLRGYYTLAGVEQAGSPVVSQSRITSLFPSPLLSGNSVRLRVNVPREMGFNYTIFDEMGRKVAFGTSRQHLFAGDNICEIGELGGYANGSYTIKFSFADGTSDSRMFQILR